VAEPDPVSWAGPAHVDFYFYYFYYLFIIIYYNIKKKNSKKKFKNPFEKFVMFSNIFLPILHNIGLYIYTVKYKSGIKIPDFLRKKLQIFLKSRCRL
jgi:hypothetical protein